MPTARSCGTCTLCCKVYRIDVLDKKAGVWCRHCRPGHGCDAYDSRPEVCRDFDCLWLSEPSISDAWKPERSKMVLSRHPATGFLYVQIDPGQPDAFNRSPYARDLAVWSARLLKSHRHVIAFVNDEATLILPDQTVRLGRMRPDEGFTVKWRYAPGGRLEYYVERP